MCWQIWYSSNTWHCSVLGSLLTVSTISSEWSISFPRRLDLNLHSHNTPTKSSIKIPKMPQNSGSGQRGPPNLPGASRQSVDPMESASGSFREGEGLLSTGGVRVDTPTPPPPYSQINDSVTPRPVERYVRADGKIGLVASQGSDAGWSTRVGILLDPSNLDNAPRTRRMEEIAIFDKDIVAAVLTGDMQRAKAIGLTKIGWPIKFYTDQMALRIVWVAAGEEFEIMDGPGFERVRLKRAIDWWRA